MVRVNQRLERTQVLDPCLKLCRGLTGTHIIKYKRLDALDRYHEDGSPDIEIWISKNEYIHILMAECKKPHGGILGKPQIKYCEKYKVYKNVLYVQITSVLQLKKIILNMSGYKDKELEEFNKIDSL